MADSPRKDLTRDLAELLMDQYGETSHVMQHVSSYELPSRTQTARVLDQCRALIFPGYFGDPVARMTRTELGDTMRSRIDDLRNSLRRQVYRGLNHKRQFSARGAAEYVDCPDCAERAGDITDTFLSQLPDLRTAIALDVQAHVAADPAATGADEVIFCYPGLYAISVYRIAHALLGLGAQIIPRIMTEIAHEKTGVDIHPGATIGESFFIDHGTGIVIGETAEIGEHVRMYQGVTLGALSVPSAEASRDKKRHPTIEDNVVIYAGATILGGKTVIGKGAVIGGNCWVTSSVGPGETVTL